MFTYIKLLGAGAVLAATAAGYWYVTGLQSDVEDLTAANAVYQVAVKEMKFSIEGLRDDIATDRARMDKFNDKIVENASEVSEIRSLFSKHDLGRIIQNKPQLFKKIAQKGTNKYYKDLEEITEWSEQ